MMPKHTPGPWTWERRPEGGEIVHLSARHNEVILPTEEEGRLSLYVTDADMALIRRAPEMYDLLKRAAGARSGGDLWEVSMKAEQLIAEIEAP